MSNRFTRSDAIKSGTNAEGDERILRPRGGDAALH